MNESWKLGNETLNKTSEVHSLQISGGIQFRKRACDSPMPANGGADCQGPRMEQQACNTQNCRKFIVCLFM